MSDQGDVASRFVLNCIPSVRTEEDWGMEDAVAAGIVVDEAPLESVDLRADWWDVQNQEDTGACVGFATADGVLRWLYVTENRIGRSARPSPRFIWMANKETDEITAYPTTFLETAGTQTKLALAVARKYGCVLEEVLPMSGRLSTMRSSAFYTLASRLRIATYHNLGRDLRAWRTWIAQRGPILTRLGVDATWDAATENDGALATYQPATVRGGHAVCLVGYTRDHFIVRNSWGDLWGDEGFAYASNAYASEAFTEAYGAVM